MKGKIDKTKHTQSCYSCPGLVEGVRISVHRQQDTHLTHDRTINVADGSVLSFETGIERGHYELYLFISYNLRVDFIVISAYFCCFFYFQCSTNKNNLKFNQ